VKEHLHKPLETKPSQLWSRWAKAAASVERGESNQKNWENKFRKLVDGYGYSLGGRIQLMLGQEYVTGERANLTAYNCYVVESPKAKETSIEQFKEVVRIAEKEASIMRRGGGVGGNISHINTVSGAKREKEFFQFLLPKGHKDFSELQDRILLKKFESVIVVNELDKTIKNNSYIEVGDSIEELFESLNEMVEKSFDSNIEQIVIDFSPLRHRNAIVKGVNGRSSGAVSWMELFELVAMLLQMDLVDNVDFAEVFSYITHLIEQG
jgi:ribonucleotide reductase alpha subunit